MTGHHDGRIIPEELIHGLYHARDQHILATSDSLRIEQGNHHVAFSMQGASFRTDIIFVYANCHNPTAHFEIHESDHDPEHDRPVSLRLQEVEGRLVQTKLNGDGDDFRSEGAPIFSSLANSVKGSMFTRLKDAARELFYRYDPQADRGICPFPRVSGVFNALGVPHNEKSVLIVEQSAEFAQITARTGDNSSRLLIAPADEVVILDDVRHGKPLYTVNMSGRSQFVTVSDNIESDDNSKRAWREALIRKRQEVTAALAY